MPPKHLQPITSSVTDNSPWQSQKISGLNHPSILSQSQAASLIIVRNSPKSSRSDSHAALCWLVIKRLHYTFPRAHRHLVGMLRFMSLTWNNRACSVLFILFLCLFLSYDPFNCISFLKFSRQLSTFSLCSSGHTFALLVLSTTYLFLFLWKSLSVLLLSFGVDSA